MAVNLNVVGFRANQAAQEAFCGYACEVTIGSTTGIKAKLLKRAVDPIIVAGGIAEKGAQLIMVALEDCPGGVVPAKNTPVVTSVGFSGSWLVVQELLYGVVSAWIGDPSGYKQGEHGFI